MQTLIAALLMITLIPSLMSSADPLLHVSVIEGNVTGLAIGDGTLAYTSDGRLTVMHANGLRREVRIDGEVELLSSSMGVFLLINDTLYALEEGGLRRLLECDDCTPFPFSPSLIAVARGDRVEIGGKIYRVGFRPSRAYWSSDGTRLLVAGYSQAALIDLVEGRILWTVEFNSKIFGAVPGNPTLVCVKGCSIHSIIDSGHVKWSRRICGCCVPISFDGMGDRLLALIHGKTLYVLSRSGDILDELEIPAYHLSADEGIAVLVDSSGSVHLLVDVGRLHYEGVSGGILLRWDLPRWVSGAFEFSLPEGRRRVEFEGGSPLLIPIRVAGPINFTI